MPRVKKFSQKMRISTTFHIKERIAANLPGQMWHLYAAKLAHTRRSSGGFAKKQGPGRSPPAHSVSRNSTRCTRGNSRARQLPNAAVSPCVSPSTKFHVKSRTRRYAPRTQFAAKFPCQCRRRRRMSADGDDFRIFDSLGPGRSPPAQKSCPHLLAVTGGGGWGIVLV